MPVIIVGAEKNFAGLRPRLFTGNVSPKTIAEVAEAIAVANPHANLDKLESGTVLTVPDLPKVALRRDISLDDASKQTISGIAEAASATLDDLTAIAKRRTRDLTAERKKLAKALAADELNAAARKDKALGANLRAVRQALSEEHALAKQRTAGLARARAEWSAELQTLRKLLP